MNIHNHNKPNPVSVFTDQNNLLQKKHNKDFQCYQTEKPKTVTVTFSMK